MKKLGLVVSVVAFGLSAVGAITYDGKVLDGEWLLNGSTDVLVRGDVSGRGDIRFQQTQGYLSMECNNTSVGNIYNDWGLFYVNTAASLGSSTFYVNDETKSGCTKTLYLWRSMTVTNPIVLGTERTANWGPRLEINKSTTVTLSGPIKVNESKILADASSKLIVSGGVCGNKIVLAAGAGSTVDITTKPLDLTGEFWVAGPGSGTAGTVSIKVGSNAATGLYGFDGATLKLGVDNPFTTPVAFAPQKDKSFSIDLDGHCIDLGSFANQGAGYGGTSTCTILNSSSASQMPTVSVKQDSDNVGTDANGAALAVSGRMNFTKKGIGALMPKTFDIQDGTLSVEGGRFLIRVAGTSRHLANTVVVAGGTLDLNGGSFTCYRLEQRGGKIINGKLVVRDANVLYADTDVAAEIVGKTVKPADTSFTYQNALASGSPLPYTYELPEGTVFYMPFDTVETLFFDYGSCGADMVVAAGTPTFAAAGKMGGCLYVDGASRLEARSGVPAGFPVGVAPVTVSCWIKPEDGCSNKGGWFSYGGTATGRGSSYTFTGSYANVKWYANDSDVYTGTTPNLLDGAWHHIVGVWDGAYRDIYVDGIRYVHQSGKPLDTDTSVFMIGKTMWDQPFKGWIDEVLVLGRAASAVEVAALYSDGIIRAGEAFSEVTVEAGTLAGGSGSLAVAYPFDSVETFLQDFSQTGATLSNSEVTFSSDSAFGTGGSASFNGSSSFLSLETFPSAIPSGAAARTLLCFVKGTSDETKEGAFISYGNETWGTGDYLNFAFRNYGEKIGLYPWGAENGCFSYDKANFLGKWQSVAAVWDGAKVSLYTNGVQALAPTSYTKSSGGGTLILNTKAEGFKIGKMFNGGTSYFKGNLDEIAVCNRVLTQDEIAAYSRTGISALMAKPLASDTMLTLAEGATLSTPYTAQTIAGLSGKGMFAAKSLTLTDRLSGATTVNGDLTLGDGIVIKAAEATTTVSGRVMFAGGGTILLPNNLPKNGSWTLVTASSFVGAEQLENCIFENLPRNTTAELKIRNGNELVLTWSKNGLILLVQ